ncbi:MAG: murein biosynthesis integral membrane protein MurJ [Syntrophales bacterium]|jgi:putative peptidoglycan lipid II flippase|nr:murein biosynthesis integral membrane protein MurJ [Syntrophales bacterium]MDY0044091.1 murein biosynthesis integral membrane protein MurJ [Syntrophales bacterium]
MTHPDPPVAEGAHNCESERSRVAKAAGVVGLATLLSRIFGFLRDVVVAAFFGAGFATDAFFVAFRIPNLLRSILAEGSLTIAFVPVYTQYLKGRSQGSAVKLVNVAVTLLSIVLSLVTVIGIIFSPWIVKIIAFGFGEDPAKYELTVFLTRLMFPYIFFMSLVALSMGILNSLRHFATPALSPVLLNISIIASAFFLRGFFKEPVTALAIGVLAGGFLQLAMQIPALWGRGVRFKPDFHFNHPGVKKIGFLMLPALFGAAVYQINIFVGTLLASFLPGGSVSYLYYADRIVQLPLGIFALAVGTASLPSFSEQAARGDYDELKQTISFSLRIILFVTIPCMVAFIILRIPIISVLFQHGRFDAASTLYTAEALFFYTLGLWAFSGTRVLVSAFYALQDTKTPVKIAFFAFIVNVIASIMLMYPLKHGGLALAVSIASSVNMTILVLILQKKIGSFLDKKFFRSAARGVIISIVMGAAMIAAMQCAGWNPESPFSARLFTLIAALVSGGVVFFIFSLSFEEGEMRTLMRMVKRKLRRRNP